MAKKKISELPAGSALNGTELVPIVQTGTTKRITAQDIANLGNASGVEGSGTINYLAKFTATSTIGNSLLFDNGSNVYLNASSGTYRFEANAGSSQYINARFYGSSHSLVQIESTTAAFQALLGFKSPTRTWSMGLQGDGRYSIYDNTANAERLTILASGNVNIGTSANVVAFGKTLTINGNATRGLLLQDNGTDSAYFYSDPNNLTLGSNAGGIALNAGGAERMRITSAGLVGIGTTTPSEKLHVSGGNIIVNSASAIGWGDRSAQIVGNTGASGFLRFDTNNAEVMRINAAGNVGIGIISPQAKLHSNADILTGYFQNGTNGIYDALKLTNNTASNTLSGNGARIQFYNNSNNSTNLIGSSIRSVNVDYGWASNLVLSSVRNNGYATQTAIDSLTLTNNGSAIFASNIGWGGVTPVGDGANCSTIEGANGAQIAARNGFAQLYIGSNVVGTPYAPIRSVAGYATQLSLDALGGTISLNRAVSGSAGSAISWINVLGFNNSGAATFSSSVTAGGEILISQAADSGMRLKSGASSLCYIDFSDANTGAPQGSIAYNHIVDALVFNAGGSNAEKMRITSVSTNFSTPAIIVNLTTTQINALTPAAGMVVFNTTLATLCFYDGTGWRKVSHSAM